MGRRDGWETLPAHGLEVPRRLAGLPSASTLAAVDAFAAPPPRLAACGRRRLKMPAEALLVPAHHQMRRSAAPPSTTAATRFQQPLKLYDEVRAAAIRRGGAPAVVFQRSDSHGSVKVATQNCTSRSPLPDVKEGWRPNTPQPKAAEATRTRLVRDAQGTMKTGAEAHLLQPSVKALPGRFRANRRQRRRTDVIVGASEAAVLDPASTKPYSCLSSDEIRAEVGAGWELVEGGE